MKTEFLQIRLTPSKKAAIRRRAKAANMTITDWLLARALPERQSEFFDLVGTVTERPKIALAELGDFLLRLSKSEFQAAVADRAPIRLQKLWANYIAAMVETAAHKKRVRPPAWVDEIPSFDAPHFASDLKNLRLHLLLASPPPFRRRGIFIDSTIGDRV